MSWAGSKDQYVNWGGGIQKLTHLDKVFYPETGFTKGDVIRYYRKIAPVILPYVRERPLTLKRYPDGVDSSRFYEKKCPSHRPKWIKTHVFGEIPYCLANDEKSLIWAANLASIEIHVTLATIRDLQCPTLVAFDLDPGDGVTPQSLCELGLELRAYLKKWDLESFPKTSGKKGLHIYVPLNASIADYSQSRGFSHYVAEYFEIRHGERVVSRMAKKIRAGKILIDWSQNVDFKTTVAVYSLRAADRPTVSTPLRWSEVVAGAKSERKSRELWGFESGDVIKRVEKHGDLFAPVLKLRQKLPPVSELKPPSRRFSAAA